MKCLFYSIFYIMHINTSSYITLNLSSDITNHFINWHLKSEQRNIMDENCINQVGVVYMSRLGHLHGSGLDLIIVTFDSFRLHVTLFRKLKNDVFHIQLSQFITRDLHITNNYITLFEKRHIQH